MDLLKIIILTFMSVMAARGLVMLINQLWPLIMNRAIFGYSMAIFSIGIFNFLVVYMGWKIKE